MGGPRGEYGPPGGPPGLLGRPLRPGAGPATGRAAALAPTGAGRDTARTTGRASADLRRPPDGVRPGVYEAAARATRNLLERQDPEGWWKGDLETNVTMDAEDLLLRQFLGIRDEATTRAAALFIRGEQREDGTWATFHGGPSELSATIEAYVALRLAGDAPDAPT